MKNMFLYKTWSLTNGKTLIFYTLNTDSYALKIEFHSDSTERTIAFQVWRFALKIKISELPF